MRDDREERDVRKSLPPLLTAAHTEVDGVFSRFYAAAQQDSALRLGGFLNGESVSFSPPFGPQFDLSRDGRRVSRSSGRTHSQTPAHASGGNFVSFDSDFRNKFPWLFNAAQHWRLLVGFSLHK